MTLYILIVEWEVKFQMKALRKYKTMNLNNKQTNESLITPAEEMSYTCKELSLPFNRAILSEHFLRPSCSAGNMMVNKTEPQKQITPSANFIIKLQDENRKTMTDLDKETLK